MQFCLFDRDDRFLRSVRWHSLVWETSEILLGLRSALDKPIHQDKEIFPSWSASPCLILAVRRDEEPSDVNTHHANVHWHKESAPMCWWYATGRVFRLSSFASSSICGINIIKWDRRFLVNNAFLSTSDFDIIITCVMDIAVGCYAYGNMFWCM